MDMYGTSPLRLVDVTFPLVYHILPQKSTLREKSDVNVKMFISYS